jgi:hypothetical protein
MDRRQFLARGSAALLPGFAGCSDEFDPVEPKTRLGRGDPITLEGDPAREYEYLESTDEVRTDSGVTMSFGAWGTQRAAAHASDAIATRLAAGGYRGGGISVGTGTVSLAELDEWAGEERPREAEFERDGELAPIVLYQYHYDREGELLSKPGIDFETLVGATPRSATVTVHFPERDYRAVLPVVCDMFWIRNE